MIAKREAGRVVRFNNAEGHGVIRADAGDELFVSFSSIDMEGFQTLREGQRVEFQRRHQPGPDGPRDVAWLVAPLE